MSTTNLFVVTVVSVLLGKAQLTLCVAQCLFCYVSMLTLALSSSHFLFIQTLKIAAQAVGDKLLMKT